MVQEGNPLHRLLVRVVFHPAVVAGLVLPPPDLKPAFAGGGEIVVRGEVGQRKVAGEIVRTRRFVSAPSLAGRKHNERVELVVVAARVWRKVNAAANGIVRVERRSRDLGGADGRLWHVRPFDRGLARPSNVVARRVGLRWVGVADRQRVPGTEWQAVLRVEIEIGELAEVRGYRRNVESAA